MPNSAVKLRLPPEMNLAPRGINTACSARLHVGTNQVCGLEIYVFDPAHDVDPDATPMFETDAPFPGTLTGSTLEVTDTRLAALMLTEAANSADEDGDAEVRDALTRLARRVGRARR